ncbi:ubiquitin conjugation factor E4 B [Angomonas deanei]|uniref:Ubiquitin elongating factor core, putative n=1 Tax=Angomonas deanei TaxID=59799 RepID=A0A7G2C3J8_9TRYP|nr:ubiquitin conjugation factor E4 B [Angomonas deanei]CAD2214270.1 Ubiquitin elongating factor core, putative [Angomonas deanei]|eukprot:EPY26526.1 ubiquitin conjugation factor E4 B [Angomonas deanei]
MGQLMFLLIEAALPIFKGSFDYSKIPACYLLGGEENPTVVHVDESIERIEHFDEENPLPKYNNETEPYKPLVHLFFLGARAVMFSATFIELYNTDRRQATHPQAGPRQRAAFQAEASLYKVILTPRKWASSRLQLVNYMAHWLLHVMGVGSNGVLPATVPVEWRYLPQKLVDSVIRATQMTVKDSLFVDGLVALMLMLMGNTDYFPKPHAHALFPAFLIELMQNPETRRVLESHPWFSNNIVRRCVQCYIAVEKSTYERVQVRYELSYCIKDFLQVNSLCAPVRDEFGAAGTVLEKFSHMAVGEVNESVDQLIEILKKMHEKMKAGADLSVNAVATRPAEREGEPPRPNAAENQESESDSEPEEGNETYHQLGQSLRNYIQLFNASMDMFIELAEQFQKGVSQNMVALQISQMLCRSLVCFAGPKSTTLKIEHADRYEYQPREILRRLVDCLTRFRRSKSFLSCVCQCGVPLDDILSSITTVVTRNLVTEDLTWRLTEMSEALKKVSKDVGDEEALWNDAPDFALDALLSTPLQHPVALPSEVKDLEDLVYVNKDTIHHLLLSEPKHPFTKEYLDEKMVEAFNNKPEVQEARKKLQAKIEEWMTEAKKNLGA